jgi:large subunit ribosomal protein L17
MLRNQATELLRYEHLTTTVPRAKELRPFVERIITIAKRGVAGSQAATSGKDSARNGHALTARRLVMHDIQDREVVSKLFDTIAPRFASRPGGYTRLLRVGFRKGDAAEIAQVELIGSEYNPRAKADTDAASEKPKAKGVGGRLRAAAERLRGKKEDEAAEAPEEGKSGKSGKSKKPASRAKAKKKSDE